MGSNQSSSSTIGDSAILSKLPPTGPVAFLLRSPLQVLSAAEYMSWAGLDRSDCYICLISSSEDKAKEHVRKTLDSIGLYPDLIAPAVSIQSTWVSRVISHGRRQMILAIFLSRAKRKFPTLVIGNYSAFEMRSVAIRFKKDVVLVDDGVATMTAMQSRRLSATTQDEAVWFSKHRLLSPNSLARRFRLTFALHMGRGAVAKELGDPTRITFFTFFRPESLGPADDYVHNDFRSLRNRRGLESDGTTWFLGSPWVESGRIRLDSYLAYLDRISGELGVFSYIRHRRESDVTLEAITGALGIQVVDLGGPVELEWSLGKTHPERVASFASTGLITARILLPDTARVISYALPSDSELGIPADISKNFRKTLHGGWIAGIEESDLLLLPRNS